MVYLSNGVENHEESDGDNELQSYDCELAESGPSTALMITTALFIISSDCQEHILGLLLWSNILSQLLIQAQEPHIASTLHVQIVLSH